jgi:hypothetical protein
LSSITVVAVQFCLRFSEISLRLLFRTYARLSFCDLNKDYSLFLSFFLNVGLKKIKIRNI